MIGMAWMRRRGRAIAFATLIGVSGTYTALAADIGGRVTDGSDSPIRNVTVVVRSISEPSKSFAAQTLDDGSYRVKSVPFGKYTIEVNARGFVGVRYGPIDVKRLSGQQRDFKLQVGDAGEGSVSTDAELIGTLRTGERRHGGAKLCLSSKEKTKCVTANELGEYEFSIEVGKYSVTVTNEGKVLWRQEIDLSQGGEYRDSITPWSAK